MGGSLPEQIVDAIHDISGRHDGTRAVHAKGVVCAGTFTATPEAAALTRAAHMQGDPVRATVRFSNGGGDPATPDSREGRSRAGREALPRRRQPDGPGLDHAAPLLRADAPRTSSSSRARESRTRRPGSRTWRSLARSSRPSRGAAGDPARAVAAGAGELRPARVPRHPRLQVDRPGRRGALDPVQLPAARGCGRPLRRGGGRAPGRLPPGGDPRAARRASRSSSSSRSRSRRRATTRTTRPSRGPMIASAWSSARCASRSSTRTRERDGDVLVFDPDARHGRHRAVRRSHPACSTRRVRGLGRAPQRGPARVSDVARPRTLDEEIIEAESPAVASLLTDEDRIERIASEMRDGLPAAVGSRAGSRRVRLGSHAPGRPGLRKGA